ncbi:hypothetical protein SO802_002224 [Lithocarpus litseifolius]|uniref:Uncharacterized protein n=1 Tax=Lithocarpus litseifolius TaxID=425828 RepID=A0AAW2E0N2_9ROSI
MLGSIRDRAVMLEVPQVTHATRGPSKYLDIWDLPDDQVIELPLNSMHQPIDEGEGLSLDGWIESKKNKDCRSKQDDLHSAGSCSFAVHAAKKSKADGRPVEHAALYQIMHTRKNGSAVNLAVQAKMDKMKELLADPSNQLHSFDMSGSTAWSSDDVYAKVMGKECKGRIRGVGFGPSPSAQSSKSTALMDSQVQSREARDNEVA